MCIRDSSIGDKKLFTISAQYNEIPKNPTPIPAIKHAQRNGMRMPSLLYANDAKKLSILKALTKIMTSINVHTPLLSY